MGNVVLSIIVPVFNQEKFLRDCLESLYDQSYEDYEVIIVNDGSTDDSEEICMEFCRKSDKYKYVKQPNTGLGNARNKGLDLANGKYIMFVDSDDAILKNSIDKIVFFIEKNNFDILYFDELICDQELKGEFIVASLPVMNINVDKTLALKNCFNPSHIWSKIYKRGLFESSRFENIWYEDMELFPQLLVQAERIGYYKVPIYMYRQHSNTITHNDHDRRNEQVLIAWEHALNLARGHKEYQQVIEYAIRESISNFIYFKSIYADRYIEWYDRNLVNASQNLSIDEGVLITEDLQLMNQAAAYGLFDLVDFLSALFNACKYGGRVRQNKYISCNVEEVIDTSFKDGDMRVDEISLKGGSPVAEAIIRRIQNENVISRYNVVKENLLDKIIIKEAIMQGCRIAIGD